MTAFDKAWGIVKNDDDPMSMAIAEMQNYPDEIAECQRIAEEFEDEPCVLHGGGNDWCYSAALPVNEDGSYCYSMMAGEAGANCACINCEEVNPLT